MRVKARVIAVKHKRTQKRAQVSVKNDQLIEWIGQLTADFQVIPKLPLCLARYPGCSSICLVSFLTGSTGREGRGNSNPTGVDAALALYAPRRGHAPAILLRHGGIGNAGSTKRRLGSSALEAPSRALDLLDLVRDLLRIHLGQDIVRRGRKQGEHGKCTVLLVLLEATS